MTDWVKLAVRYYADPRIETLDEAAELLFVRGLARAGEIGQAGYIPETSLPELTRRRRHAALVNELLSSGLWTRVNGGYQVTAWSDWQDGIDELARRRAADRDRKRRKRASVRGQSAEVRTPEGEEEGEGVKGRDPPNGPQSADTPPPRTCPKHTNDPNPPNCGPCKDARLAWGNHRNQRAKQRALSAAQQRRSTPTCRRCGRKHIDAEPCPADREDRA